MKRKSQRRRSRFIKLRARPPYTQAGKTTYPETRNKTGVYIIRKNQKIVYIGFSAKDIYRTMYRHFQEWNHPGQPVITYVKQLKRHKFSVQITLCPPATAARLERALILKYHPTDNPNQYESDQLTAQLETMINDFLEEKTITAGEEPF